MQVAGASRPQLTHFLCIPLATAVGRPQLTNSLATFHADIAATTVSMTSGSTGGAYSSNDRNATTKRGHLPAKALRPVGTLHLTLGTLALDGDRLTQAMARLRTLAPKGPTEEASSSSSSTTPTISISLVGLHSMQPPARSTVLYASPVDKSTDRLAAAGGPFLELCERVRSTMSDFMVHEDRPLLLHATIVNTVYARGGGGRRGGRGGRGGHGGRGGGGGGRGGGGGGRGGGGGGRGGARITFDARDLIEKYEDFVWMENMPVKSVALCRMGAQPTAVDDDGEVVDAAYPVEAEVMI